MAKVVNTGIFLSLLLLMAACTSSTTKIDLAGISSDVKIKRFEKDLVQKLTEDSLTGWSALKNDYGSFADMFAFQVLQIPEGNDTAVTVNLRLFTSDSEIKEIAHSVDSAFSDMSEIKNDLDLFLKHYQFYFPDKLTPEIVTYLSAFNYAVITTDSVIGIGLDMFLGSESVFYPRLGIPKYMSARFSREYIVPSVIKGWFQSDYEQSEVKKEFLSQMIYQGKLLYYIDAMAPQLNDTLKIGFTSKQLNWCEQNESRLWSFFIEKKMLFSSDASEYAKFINDGPASTGFSPDAPSRLGAWIGWNIVKAYMQKNDEVTLPELLKENDALKILEKSGYKPKR
jgi:gliding motility-associated lipoprotein GldB